MTPEWGMSLHTLPPETQFLLLELEPAQPPAGSSGSGSSSSGGNGSAGADGGGGGGSGVAAVGRYALVLPLIDGDFRATCRPNR
jgi:hypothetical protein